MRKINIIIILIFIILAGLLYISLRLGLDDAIQNTLSKKASNNQTGNNIIISRPPDQPESEEDQDQQDEEDEEKQDSGEQSGTNGTGEIQDYCTQVVAYSLLDFSEQETCNLYQGETCIDKTLNCTVSVQNLDHSIGGDFTVRFEFEDYATGETILALTQTQHVEPRQISPFSRERNFQSPEARKNIDCKFSTESAPSLVIC
ncbi:MAG: hypothetical protein ABH864_06855 [archaeon]